MKNRVAALGIAALALSGCDSTARQQIRVVGSSTVYPFTTAVAERFARANPNYKAPIVESTGTGAGMKLFCAGIGAQFPDAENASRRIKKSEYEDCRKNGVNNIIEVQVGIDGLAFIEGNRARPMKLELTDIYRAIAGQPLWQAEHRADLGRREPGAAGDPDPGLWAAADLGDARRAGRDDPGESLRPEPGDEGAEGVGLGPTPGHLHQGARGRPLYRGRRERQSDGPEGVAEPRARSGSWASASWSRTRPGCAA
jgi:hypothetical protein